MSLVGIVLFVLQIAVFVTAVYAFVHAALQRPDAYTATDKLTKPVWLVILGIGALLAFVALRGAGMDVLLPVVAICAASIYLVDVRPRLLEVQGKSR